jgi:pyruvate dehydrogenase E1 component
MANLGGHDMASLLQAFESRANDPNPTVFIAYTVKGFGLPLAGHKDNHAGLMTEAQMASFRASNQVREGHEWDKFEGLALPAHEIQEFLSRMPFTQESRRKLEAPRLSIPETLPQPKSDGLMSTQQGFGLILAEIGRSDAPFADRIVTTSPDVTVSTNLGGWVNRRKLFARRPAKDIFRAEKIPSTYVWDFAPQGQHIELGIAEMNLFLLLSALGLSHQLFGERLLPVGTLYDPFIARGLDALNYACYQDARFLLVATPSGITLSGEGGAHQSIGTPLIGMAQDGLAAFEPAFVDELAVMLRFAFDYVQRDGDAEPDARTWLRDSTGGSVYLRLSTRPLEQPRRAMVPQLARAIVDGAYWLREPGPNAEAVIAYSGALAPEAIAAIGRLGEDRRDIGLLAVTSADRLNAGWTAAQRARENGLAHASSHVERLLKPLPRHCGVVTVLDGHPATLGWLGSVAGHRTRSLGVEHFGQTGSLAELYRHYGIDADGIVEAVEGIAPGRPVRHIRSV